MGIKTAAPEHEILDLLKERWSPRAFSSQRVEPENLRRLFEAARWSASSFGEEPWRFLVTNRDDAEQHERLASCLRPGNAWARQAPVLGLSVASLKFTQNGRPNRHALHDVGQAMAYLTTQAMSMGIYVHQMAGYDVDKVRESCRIPEDHDPVAMFALGYLGDPDSLPEDRREAERAPRKRKPLTELVFGSIFGERSGIL
jgi:nitroreductase